MKSMLDGFSGTVQSDGYGAYECYAKGRNQREHDAGRPKAIELAACWAHGRRKVFEARAERGRLEFDRAAIDCVAFICVAFVRIPFVFPGDGRVF